MQRGGILYETHLTGTYMAGPESQSVVTDAEEESSLRTSEKVKRILILS